MAFDLFLRYMHSNKFVSALIITAAVTLLTLAGCPSPETGGPDDPRPVVVDDGPFKPTAETLEKARASRHVLYTNLGEEYHGVLARIFRNGNVVFVTEKGETVEFSKEEVESVEFTKPRFQDEFKNVTEIPDPVLKKYFTIDPSEKDYPGANYLTAFEKVSLDLRGEEIVITERRLIKVLRRAGEYLHIQTRDYLEDSQSLELVFARTVTADGEIVNIVDNALEDGSVNGMYPAYDNLRRLKFSLKNVTAGNWIDVKTRKTIKPDPLRPLFVREYFQYFEPIIEKTLKIVLPPEAENSNNPYLFGVRNFEDSITRVESLDNETGFTVVTFRAENRSLVERERNLPPFSTFFPCVTVTSKDATERFFQAYRGYVKKDRPGEETKKTLRSVVGEARGGDVARKLYEFIQKRFEIVEVPAEDYSLAPHEADETFARRKGNPLDLAWMYHRGLAALGVESDFALAAPLDAGNPEPGKGEIAEFTRAVVILGGKGEKTFVSFSSEHASFGVLPPALRGTKALVLTGEKPAVVETPGDKPREEVWKEILSVEVKADGSIRVKKTVDVSGRYAESWRALSEKKPGELKQRFESMAAGVHPRAKLLSWKTENLDDTSKKPVVEMEYEVPGYALSAGGRYLVFKLPEVDYSSWEIEKSERSFPMWWGETEKRVKAIEFSIPDGFRVKYRPESYANPSKHGGLSYRADFAVEGRTVRFRDEFIRRSPGIPASAYADYLACVNARAKVSGEYVIFEKQE